jgi:hypothetical protein
MKRIILFLVVAATTATAVHAETYRWTDQEGTIHISDSLQSVPAPYRKSAQAGDASLAKTGTTGNGAAASGKTVPGTADTGVSAQVDAMKDKMMSDPGIMQLILGMLNNPDLQAILNDPALVKAVQAGDISSLINNPAFMKLVDNPQVKEIQNRLLKDGIQ